MRTEEQALGLALAMEARRSRIGESHVKPLNDLVRACRASRGVSNDVPWFDPEDGGTDARVLLLLQAPGPRAVETGFVSMDNPDPTARSIRLLLGEAGLPRREVVIWNIVPWIPRDAGSKASFRAPTAQERLEGAAFLKQAIGLCPRISTVVTLGGQARDGWKAGRQTIGLGRDFVVVHTWHPSSRGLNGGQGRRGDVLLAFRRALPRQ